MTYELNKTYTTKILKGSWKVSSPWGRRDLNGDGDTNDLYEYHRGVDFATPIGIHCLAPDAGRVIFNRLDQHRGKYIVIRTHKDGMYYFYNHLNTVHVKENQEVKGGQHVADTGNSGYSTGAHLHLGVANKLSSGWFISSDWVDPYKYTVQTQAQSNQPKTMSQSQLSQQREEGKIDQSKEVSTILSEWIPTINQEFTLNTNNWDAGKYQYELNNKIRTFVESKDRKIAELEALIKDTEGKLNQTMQLQRDTADTLENKTVEAEANRSEVDRLRDEIKNSKTKWSTNKFAVGGSQGGGLYVGIGGFVSLLVASLMVAFPEYAEEIRQLGDLAQGKDGVQLTTLAPLVGGFMVGTANFITKLVKDYYKAKQPEVKIVTPTEITTVKK